MGDYHGRTRTNFFKVNNINKFSNFMSNVVAEELRITIQNSRVCDLLNAAVYMARELS